MQKKGASFRRISRHRLGRSFPPQSCTALHYVRVLERAVINLRTSRSEPPRFYAQSRKQDYCSAKEEGPHDHRDGTTSNRKLRLRRAAFDREVEVFEDAFLPVLQAGFGAPPRSGQIDEAIPHFRLTFLRQCRIVMACRSFARRPICVRLLSSFQKTNYGRRRTRSQPIHCIGPSSRERAVAARPGQDEADRGSAAAYG